MSTRPTAPVLSGEVFDILKGKGLASTVLHLAAHGGPPSVAPCLMGANEPTDGQRQTEVHDETQTQTQREGPTSRLCE